MPQINPAVLNGTKLFKDKLTTRRLTSKVTRLGRELTSAQTALRTANARLANTLRISDADAREVAGVLETGYFADR